MITEHKKMYLNWQTIPIFYQIWVAKMNGGVKSFNQKLKSSHYRMENLPIGIETQNANLVIKRQI